MSALPCIFCQIARAPSFSTRVLYQDDKIVAFQDIKPAAFRHYLIIPIEHIPTVKTLQRGPHHYTLAIIKSNHQIQFITCLMWVKPCYIGMLAPVMNIGLAFINLPLTVLAISTFIALHFLLFLAGNVSNTHHWGP